MLLLEKFYVRKNYYIDETGYYWYRVDTLFNKYKPVWHDAVGNRILEKWLTSLQDRFEFFCRSVDSIKIETKKRPNHITESKILYNLTYLSACIPGIYDNIAHYLNAKFDLNIQKEHVTLKQNVNKLATGKNSTFITALESKCQPLAEYLSREDIQNKIQLVYPVRDEFVHRDQVTSLIYSDGVQRNLKNLIIVSDDLYDKFIALKNIRIDYTYCFMVNNPHYKLIDPYKFVSILEEITLNIVNTILSLIPTDERNVARYSNTEIPFHGNIPWYF